LSLNACPYRAMFVLLRRPRVFGSIEATTILTYGGWHRIRGGKRSKESHSLNPFEIRAWLARSETGESGRCSRRLNPFEIRAWLAPGNLPSTLSRSSVLIPLKSGHGWHTDGLTYSRLCKPRLNPFEIRAWLAHCRGYCHGSRSSVLIPLKSGHGWHKYCQMRHTHSQVLIPLKSGHGWHISVQ